MSLLIRINIRESHWFSGMILTTGVRGSKIIFEMSVFMIARQQLLEIKRVY